MAEIQARLVRKVDGGACNYDKYELECIKCGTHYFQCRYDNRTVPYCGICRREMAKDRNKEYKEKREKRIETSIWNKAVDKTAETIKNLYSLTIEEEKLIDEAIMKIKH